MYSFKNLPFNMDALALMRIDEKLGFSMDSAIDGNQLKRFRALKTIFNSTNFKFELENDFYKEILNLIKEINVMFKEHPVNRSNKQQMINFYAIRTDNIEEKLDRFEEILNRLLYQYDFIYLKKLRNISPEEEVAGDY